MRGKSEVGLVIFFAAVVIVYEVVRDPGEEAADESPINQIAVFVVGGELEGGVVAVVEDAHRRKSFSIHIWRSNSRLMAE